MTEQTKTKTELMTNEVFSVTRKILVVEELAQKQKNHNENINFVIDKLEK
jgi:hypothetical protein